MPRAGLAAWVRFGAQRLLVPLLAEFTLLYPAREFLPLKTAAVIAFQQQRMRAAPVAEVASP